MERTISDEEKIRRAIEISQRRNKTDYTTETTRVYANNNKKDYKLFKKMILQIVICLLIYLIYYLISTTNYTFSKKIVNSTTEILSYDINLEKIYNSCINYFTTIFNNEKNSEEETITNSINTIENVVQENVINNNITNTVVIDNQQDEESVKKEEKNESKEETAMKEDAQKAKKICKFYKPLTGKVTSEFGEREVITSGMTSEHKGIDIAANSGTNIKAAIAGKVTVAEENSEYREIYKNRKWRTDDCLCTL